MAGFLYLYSATSGYICIVVAEYKNENRYTLKIQRSSETSEMVSHP